MILACAKEKYNRIRFELFETTIRPIADKMDVYYLFGQSDNTPVIPTHKNVRMLIAPCADNWEDIPLKVYHGFNTLGNHGYNYIIKLDENISIREPTLMIEQIDSEIIDNPYIALKEATARGDASQLVFSYYHMHKCANRHLFSMPSVMTNVSYAAGPGYVLRRDAYLKISESILQNTLFEDFGVGFNLYLNGIFPFKGATASMRLLRDPDIVPEIILIRSVPADFKQYFFQLMKHNPVVSKHLYMLIHGGLGNQLFQLATAIAYCSKTNRKLYLFTNPRNGRKYYWDTLLPQFGATLTNISDIAINKQFNESTFSYSPLPLFNEAKVSMTGYFQSDKYFGEYRHILKRIVQFPKDIRKSLTDKYKEDLWTPNHVIVHARRGDYVAASDYHALQPDEYYVAAKALIETRISEPTYILISDDPEYWKRSPVFADSKVLHFNEDDIETFYLIMNSHNIVMANSTFSWWGSYLSDASTVIAPKTWFGPKGPADWSSIYVDGWTVL